MDSRDNQERNDFQLSSSDMLDLIRKAEAEGKDIILVVAERDADDTCELQTGCGHCITNVEDSDIAATELVAAAQSISEDNMSFFLAAGDVLRDAQFQTKGERYFAGKYFKSIFEELFGSIDDYK